MLSVNQPVVLFSPYPSDAPLLPLLTWLGLYHYRVYLREVYSYDTTSRCFALVFRGVFPRIGNADNVDENQIAAYLTLGSSLCLPIELSMNMLILFVIYMDGVRYV